MILTDTGPLVALLDADDPYHEVRRCFASFALGPLLTTVGVLTEAMYLLGEPGYRYLERPSWNLRATATYPAGSRRQQK